MVAVRVKRTYFYRTYSILTWERHATRMPCSYVLPLLRFCLSILVRHFVNLILDENENVSLDTERSKQTKHMVSIEIYERIKLNERNNNRRNQSETFIYIRLRIRRHVNKIILEFYYLHNIIAHMKIDRCIAVQSNPIRYETRKNEKQHFELLKMF